uniref:Ig-like domain-containing protein n=1 Tax=Cyprinus carpio carpio TaxID=630221 RepID=A0A9J8AVN8_CYPCA
MGSSTLLLKLLLMSLVYSGLTEVTSVVNANPVTLTCDIQGGENIQWTYRSFKDPHDTYRTTEAEFSFTANVSDSGVYSCRGERSDTSAAVTLTVSVKPEVKVTPDQRVFRGETVTLTCDIQGGGDIQWTYSWFKDGSVIPDITERDYNITSVSDSAVYSCRGERSDINSVVTLTVSALPTSTLTVTPDSPVFTGETVYLTCVINSDHSDWRYEWYKDTDSVMLQTSERYTVNRNTLTIERSEISDAGLYTCRGDIDGRSVSSQSSSAVSLLVKDLPRSTLTVTPDSPVFTGERVSLTCVIESDSNWRQRNGLKYDRRYDWTYYQTAEWRYEWYKGRKDNNVILKDSQHYTVNTDTLTIRGATESDQGQFWCRGQRDERPKSSQLRSVSLTVKDLPRSTLTVTPDSPVFTGERVSLTCVIESDSNWRQRNGLKYDQRYDWTYYQTAEWRYEWYKGRKDNNVILKDSQHYTVNTDTLTIRGATESDQGQFWCRGQRDERPKSSQLRSVSLTVKALPTSTLTVTPDSTVFTGETVYLTCVINSDHSDWRYEWYKDTDSVMLQTSERYTVKGNTLTIERSKTSDAGLYTCRGDIDGRSVSSQSSSVYLSVKALPTSTLTVTAKNPVFTGERVSLTCVIESYSNWRQRNGLEYDQRYDWTYYKTYEWRYVWYKGRTDNYVILKDSQHYTVNTDTLTVRAVTTSDAGQFWCRGQRDKRPKSSQSSSVSLTVMARPKAVVKVTPDQRVFRGETVTLTCDIQGAGDIQWTYSWFKDGNTFYPYRTTAEISFRADYVSYSVKYSCRGERSDSQRSDTSAAVTLTVSDLPTSTLTVTPDSPVFTGERVDLTCEIESYSNWRYEWYKGSVMLQTSERYTVNTDTLTIRAVTTSDAGQFWCRGQRDKRPNSSQSSSVSLTVKDSPRSTLTVTPDSPVFTGERVSLKCVIESYSNWRWRIGLTYDQTYEWRYEWYKGSVMLQTSERYTVNTDTLTITAVTTSDAGQFWCRGQRDKRPNSSQSSSVSLTVKDLPRPTLTVTPDSPVFTGETVNLTCVINSNHSDWKYEWYKGTNNSVKLQTSERYTIDRDTLTIRGLNESDQDQFWCRGQRDKRPNSSQQSERINLSVNVSAASSSLLVTGVVVGLSVCLLFFLSLLLMWRYKKNKDQQRNINQTSVPNQSAQSQLENSPLQSAGSDHIYDDVTTVKNRDKDDPEPLADVTYSEVTVKKKMDKEDTIAESNNVTYSEVGKRGKKCKSKDINTAGPSDLTYAQINIQDKKKTKGKGAGLSDVLIEMKTKNKHSGKSSESGDTLYSELKHNTDRDADAGVGDATYAQSIKKKNKTNADAEVGDATYAQSIKKKNKTHADAEVGDATYAAPIRKKNKTRR